MINVTVLGLVAKPQDMWLLCQVNAKFLCCTVSSGLILHALALDLMLAIWLKGVFKCIFMYVSISSDFFPSLLPFWRSHFFHPLIIHIALRNHIWMWYYFLPFSSSLLICQLYWKICGHFANFSHMTSLKNPFLGGIFSYLKSPVVALTKPKPRKKKLNFCKLSQMQCNTEGKHIITII